MYAELEVGFGRRTVSRALKSIWFRVLVTASLLGVVVSRIDWARMASRVGHGSPVDFIAAVGLVLAALVIGAMRWWWLLHRARIPLVGTAMARVYAVSTFSNTFLPTAVGGDVTRALLVARRGPLLTRVVTTILVDRAGGLVGLLGMAWIAFALQPAAVPAGATAFLSWVSVATLAGSLVFLAGLFRGSRLARAVIPRSLMSTARESRDLLRLYVADPATPMVLVVSSLIYQALISLQLVMLAHAIDIGLSFAAAAVVLALVTVVTLIPVSIGGFGVREGSYVVLLGLSSIAATEAALISVLSVATLFIASLPGAFFLVRKGVAPALGATTT